MGATVLLVDDEPLLLNGVSVLLGCEEDVEVVGEASDPETAVCLVGESCPDVVIQELWMHGDRAGTNLCKDIKNLVPDPPRVLFYTARNSHEDVYRCYLAGADGFVHKREEPRRLLDAVRQVSIGKRVWLLGAAPDEASATCGASDEILLTEKEQEVLSLVLGGYPNRRIADTLCLGVTTVKTHVRHIFKKLGVSSREELFLSHRHTSHPRASTMPRERYEAGG